MRHIDGLIKGTTKGKEYLAKRLKNCDDADIRYMLQGILERGLSAFAVSKELSESKKVKATRSKNTLFSHARKLEKEILWDVRGVATHTLLNSLLENGSVICPEELESDLRRMLHEMRRRYKVNRIAIANMRRTL